VRFVSLVGLGHLMGGFDAMGRYLLRNTGVGCLMLLLSGVTAVGQTRTPVVVELFTSEGCSSCPPADALLMKLDQEQPVAGAEIIVLEEHVDYWEGLGWHDRFSAHQYTDRQNVYGRHFNLNDVYTPQMVVDGAEQFVGNDAAKARQAIGHAAQSAKVKLTLSEVSADGHRVSGVVSGAGELGKGDLFAALIDPSATTQVKGGENGGRVLHHAGVVRSLVRIGSLEDLAKGPVKFALTAPADAAAKERMVVFAQRSGQGLVVGAAVEAVEQHGGAQKTVAMR
jgi:hypothetical protein